MQMQISEVRVWENVHHRMEEAVAAGRYWGLEAKGDQGRRKVLNREFDSYLCCQAEKPNSRGPNKKLSY